MNNPSSEVGYLPMSSGPGRLGFEMFHTMDAIASAVDWVSRKN